MIDFTLTLILGAILFVTGFIFLVKGTKYIKSWGKRYSIVNKTYVLTGIFLIILAITLISWQAILRQ